MRRGVVVVLASLLAGCAQGVEVDSLDLAEEPASAPAPSAAPTTPATATGGAPSLPGAPALETVAGLAPGHAFPSREPPVAGCRKSAFCDDFESGIPGARWSRSVATEGILDFDGLSSSLGSHALRARTTAEGGAAYLSLDGRKLGAQWAGSLAFSMRIDAVPSVGVGGPELSVADATGGRTRIGFSVRRDGIVLHQAFDTCSGASCEARSDVVSDVKPGEWRRLVVAIETSNTAAPPYGRIEVTIDASALVTLPLVVAPFDGQASVQAGITVADAVPATLRIDDVVFHTH